MVDLLAAEYVMREKYLPPVLQDEYSGRFPELFGALLSRLGRAPQIPGFTQIEPLGEGGMGVVYKARQLHPERFVALKMFLAGCCPSAEERRLPNRSQRDRQTEPPPHRTNPRGQRHQGQPFLVLEFCEGGTLADQIRTKGRLSPAEAAKVVTKLADAVHAAHVKGIIHRDLKPGNILLTDNCELKIADFGLVKLTGEPGELTQAGVVLGTPLYMAPEQADGDSKAIGPHTDVYALGAILYELLTGQTPFRGDSVEDVLRQVKYQLPRPPREFVKEVPPDLETVCLTCLAKDIGQRYATALEMRDDLVHVLKDEPIKGSQNDFRAQVWRWCRRQRLWLGLAAMVVLAFLVAGVSFLWASYWEGVKDTATKERLEVLRRRQNAVANRPALSAKVAAEYAGLFQDYFRSPVQELNPAHAARGRHSRIAVELAIGLDDYAALRKEQGAAEAEWKSLVQLAKEIDTDPSGICYVTSSLPAITSAAGIGGVD